MTQDKLAELSGLSQSQLSAVERGYRYGTLKTWQNLARALNVSVSWLTEGQRFLDDAGSGVDDVLADEQAPAGLRELAQDDAMLEQLKIAPQEWHALRSLDYPFGLSRQAYLSILQTLRMDQR